MRSCPYCGMGSTSPASQGHTTGALSKEECRKIKEFEREESKPTDKESAMLAILKDTLEDLETFIEQEDLPDDHFLVRMPKARIEQYLDRVDIDE